MGIAKKIFLSSFLLLMFLCFSVSSQSLNNPGVFETLTISGHYLANVNRNMFHDYWKPPHGFELQFETPFYLGIVEGGIQMSNISACQSGQPDYASHFIFLGWGLERKLNSKLHIYSGLRIGNYYMNFDDDFIYPTLKSESELGLGIKTRFRYDVGHNFSIILGGEYRIIYTHQRIYLSSAVVGVSKSFDCPKWLREFLL